MNLKINYEYWEDVIPPRCRKPRPEKRSDTLEIEIPEMEDSNFPLAFVVTKNVEELERTEIRLDVTAKQLYSKSNRWTSNDLATRKIGWWPNGLSQADVVDAICSAYRPIRLYNGEVWEACNEPIYEVCTFGLGNNHGGTAVMIRDHYSDDHLNAWAFRADEYNEAVEKALEVAENRGDTESIESIKTTKEIYFIEVLMPEAITVPYAYERDILILREKIAKEIENRLGETPQTLLDYVFYKLWPNRKQYKYSRQIGEAVSKTILDLAVDAIGIMQEWGTQEPEIIDTVTNYLINNGTENTSSGNWCFYVDELAEKFGIILTPESKEWQLINSRLNANWAVADVTFDGDCIDICYYLEYCPSYEPTTEEEAEELGIFEQECNNCGARFKVRYMRDGTYIYIDEPCECDSDFSPVEGNPSMSEWLAHKGKE